MRLVSGLLAALIALTPMAGVALAATDPPQTPPKALYLDPPIDPAHPATTLEIEIPSHGALMNAIIYRPSGPGPFPLVVFVHGLPGNEQSLDLAQTLRRAGWAVLTFHYRGAFGSEGTFSIDNTLEDADAVIDKVRAPGVAAAWNVDPARIVLMGHSGRPGCGPRLGPCARTPGHRDDRPLGPQRPGRNPAPDDTGAAA